MSESPIGQREASLWEATAIPLPVFAPLAGEAEAEVGIIGGGLTGLSAALHLAQRGASVVVLDAGSIGWGSSGRNGGFVSSAWRASLPEISRQQGHAAAARMYRLGIEAVEGLGSLCERLGLAEASYRRAGHITGAVNAAGLRRLAAKADWLRRQFGDRAHRLLERDEAAMLTGSAMFHGGLLAEVEACVHPMNLVRGLAGRVAQAGASLHEGSCVTGVNREAGGFVLMTPHGRLRARHVIVATNAYSDLAPPTARYARGIIPFESAAIATEPLPAALIARILPQGHVGSDSKRVLRWFRIVEGRLVFGGRGAFRPGRGDGVKFARLRANMIEMFPETETLGIAWRWSGRVAMTGDFMAHIGADDGIFYALGYNGTGVALSVELGRMLAAMVRGETVDPGPLGRPLSPLPLPWLARPGARLVAGWYQTLDALGL